jgi:hypothetical protein
MAAFNKFQDFTEQLLRGTHNFASHTFKAVLTNSAPTSAMDELADITEISAGNGYTAGGMTLDSVTLSEASGVAKVTIADEVLTASGAIGPFRYVVIYNDTSTGNNLVGWYDYGSSISLANGETVT